MPVLTVSEKTSPGLGFSRKRWMQPSSLVITTPYSRGLATRVSTRVAAAPRRRWNSTAGRRSKSVSASPQMMRKVSCEAIQEAAHAAGGAEGHVFDHVVEGEAELVAVAKVAFHFIREVVQGGEGLGDALVAEEVDDVVHDGPVGDRRHRLGQV